MPAFEYYATFDESISILRDVCEQGFRIIAEPGPFDEPKAPSFDSVTDTLVDLLKMAPNFYLAGSFTRFPVQFSHLKSGPAAGKYIVRFLAQGPLMQSIVGRLKVVDDKPTLLPGDVSYQTEYRNPVTDEWEKATPEAKAAYRKAVATIKKRCVRYRAGIDIFIAPEALKLFESGKARINDPEIVRPAGGS
jgi:hypothetical protein